MFTITHRIYTYRDEKRTDKRKNPLSSEYCAIRNNFKRQPHLHGLEKAAHSI